MVEEKDMSLIEQANAAALRLENANMVAMEANKAKLALIEREEKLQNNKLLGGSSFVGNTEQVQISEKEKMAADLKNYWKGTALEKVFQ